MILGSYLSKSFGKSNTGCFKSFKFPTPLTTTRKTTASPLFTTFLSKEEDIVNEPTPPEKFAGLLGNGRTVIDNEGAFIAFLISV